ncbi:MAG: hypothetical protein Q8907_10790 [Bacteroidota bacterium]|nr:hypothetical protein [Bacteroidota bacterium]MDP4274754.1 hypothetical protein [Bacteroidota bacterium]
MEENIQKNKGLTVVLVIIILILITLLAIVFSKYKQKNVELSGMTDIKTQVEVQKNDLSKQMNDIIVQYDSMKTTNNRANVQLENEKHKVKQLLALNASSVEKVRLYEKELQTLRQIMRSYIVQIDSLNQKNKYLVNENVDVKTKLGKAKDENTQLTQQRDELNTKVQKAAVMAAKNILVTPLNKKGKEKNKIKSIDKLRACFTIRENAIVPAGAKMIYIRILRPDDKVLTNPEKGTFLFQEQNIVYTAKREVEYENKDVDLCIYCNAANELIGGNYTLDIFADGNLIGSSTFSLAK